MDPARTRIADCAAAIAHRCDLRYLGAGDSRLPDSALPDSGAAGGRQNARCRVAETLAERTVHRVRDAGWLRLVDHHRHTDRNDHRVFAPGRELRLSASGVLTERAEDRDRAAV